MRKKATMAKLIGATPLPSTVKTRKPIERKYFTKDAIAMCFENPRQWVQLGEEEMDKSYAGSLEKQAERLGFEFYFSPTQKGTKENGYAYKGIPQARYIPVESSGYAEALGAEERKRAKKAKKKAKALAQSEQAVAA